MLPAVVIKFAAVLAKMLLKIAALHSVILLIAMADTLLTEWLCARVRSGIMRTKNTRYLSTISCARASASSMWPKMFSRPITVSKPDLAKAIRGWRCTPESSSAVPCRRHLP
jgi:hypothetical protein